jgi:histidine ammonia-lyase
LTTSVALDGRSLRLADVVAVAQGDARVTVRDFAALDASRAWLDERLGAQASGRGVAPIYGVTTGFGPSRGMHLLPHEIEEAQLNLVRSHALGLALSDADWFPAEVVRATLLLRANAFLAGRSAVRREIVDLLLRLLAADVLPRVPLRGSVGASGDLAPLSHLALVLVGEGEASVADGRGGRETLGGAEALRRAGLSPLRLLAKEGLALINGTTISCAVLALALHDAENLALAADAACTLSLEALGGCARALDQQVQAARGHAGQADAAAAMRALLEGSRLVAATDDAQDNYSLRCAPQVHGASRDALSWVRLLVETEINGVTDNPLFFCLPGDAPPWDLAFASNARAHDRTLDEAPVYSAGNFHGQPIGLGADLLAIAVAELASISERRIALLLDPQFSRGLPAQLSTRPGVQSGLMLAQYVAASVVSENKTLAHPASVDSIPTGNGAEDHVPMSAWAARKARQMVDNSASVLALELLCATQAIDWRSVRRDPRVGPAAPPGGSEVARFAALAEAEPAAGLGSGTRGVHALVRSLSPRVVDDRSLAKDAAAVARALLAGRVAVAAGKAMRPLRALRFEPT